MKIPLALLKHDVETTQSVENVTLDGLHLASPALQTKPEHTRCTVQRKDAKLPKRHLKSSKRNRLAHSLNDGAALLLTELAKKHQCQMYVLGFDPLQRGGARSRERVFQSVLLGQNGPARDVVQLEGNEETHEFCGFYPSALRRLVNQQQAQQIESSLRRLELDLLPATHKLKRFDVVLAPRCDGDCDRAYRLLRRATIRTRDTRNPNAGRGFCKSTNRVGHCLGDRFAYGAVLGYERFGDAK